MFGSAGLIYYDENLSLETSQTLNLMAVMPKRGNDQKLIISNLHCEDTMMKHSIFGFVRVTVSFLVFFSLLCLFTLGMIRAANADTCPNDEFNENTLNSAKWDVFRGSPTVNGRELLLAAKSATRAEIQSKTACSYGTLQTTITSSNWKPQSGPTKQTDTSFGFENFIGANGQCHYAVILVGNGHLGVLRAEPDAQGNCIGDPINQKYIPISNWDAVRTGAGGKINLTLTWTPNWVTLMVNDGGVNNGAATYSGPTDIPAMPLKIRLNADCKAIAGNSGCTSDSDEAYTIDNINSNAITSTNWLSTAECLSNGMEKGYSNYLSSAPSSRGVYSNYLYRYYALTKAYLAISMVNNHVYYQGPDNMLQDEGPLAKWLPRVGCQQPVSPPPLAECLFNWAEANYPSLFSPAGSSTVDIGISNYRYYAASRAYLHLSTGDNHLYYQGPDGALQDEGAIAKWLSQAGCQ